MVGGKTLENSVVRVNPNNHKFERERMFAPKWSRGLQFFEQRVNQSLICAEAQHDGTTNMRLKELTILRRGGGTPGTHKHRIFEFVFHSMGLITIVT